VRSGRWDLLHLHEPLVPAVCLTAVLAAPLPVVGTFHRYGPGAGWYRRFAFVTRPAMRRIDARIAVSRAAADHVARTFPGRFRIIPNGLDVAAHALPAERHGTRIVFVGRSEPRKGLAVLLAAFAHLPDGVHLDLVGVRPQELRRLASRLPPEVARRVHAHGRVGDEERRRLLAEADVLCAPSLRGESFGIVLAEGMAAGLPVVASAIPGYIDLVSEEWGRLVPPGDERALAAALAQILADRSLREALGAAGRREAQRLDWSRVAGEVLAVYEEVLGLRRAAPGPVPAG
jgi:phosphatidylinositol alpha-mannosyltransferase